MMFDDNAKAIMQSALLPNAVDTIHNGNVATLRTLSNMQAWRGTTLDKTVIVSSAGNGTSFDGLDTFNTNTTDTKVRLQFSPTGREQPVTIVGMEVDVNHTSDRAMELLAGAIEEATNEATDAIGTILYGIGTGKDFMGFGAIIDDGGDYATYGSLARGTYPSLKANETDLGAALTLDAMAAMYSSCQVATNRPTIIYTTPTIFDAYEKLAQATISHNVNATLPKGLVTANKFLATGGLQGEMGFTALSYRGTPFVADEKCPEGTMWFVNERHLAFYGLKATLKGYTQIAIAGNQEIEGVYADEPQKSLGFSWSGFLPPQDQYGLVGHILLMGQLVSFNPRLHGVINTIG